MSAIVITPGSPLANAYTDEAGADAYFLNRVASQAWTAADVDTRRRVLIQATRELDAYMDWLGIATYAEQVLGFPRLGLIEPETRGFVDPTTIPSRVVWATCEQALALLGGDRATYENAAASAGLKRIQAGAVELEFQDGIHLSGSTKTVLIPSAINYVSCWGRQQQSGLGGTVSLVRS